MKIYLAAPIFTTAQLEVVEMMKLYAEDAGHQVFSPYHNSQDIWKGRAPKDCTLEERRLVLDDNIRNIDWCECLLAWVGGMGGFTDPGVVWEMGYAFRAGKLTAAYIDDSDERGSMNLMLAGTIDLVAKGDGELGSLLHTLPEDPLIRARRKFDPDRHLAQDKEPIV